jgi:hypothetical protein
MCGGWTPRVERFDSADEFREFRLPGGQTIVLCHACELEEFMVPGGWGWRLGLPTYQLPINSLQQVRRVEQPQFGRDKFCLSCNLRLAFLKTVAECTGASG